MHVGCHYKMHVESKVYMEHIMFGLLIIAQDRNGTIALGRNGTKYLIACACNHDAGTHVRQQHSAILEPLHLRQIAEMCVQNVACLGFVVVLLAPLREGRACVSILPARKLSRVTRVTLLYPRAAFTESRVTRVTLLLAHRRTCCLSLVSRSI